MKNGQTPSQLPPPPPPPSIPPPPAPLNSAMSVYATIKSSSMLRFDGLDSSGGANMCGTLGGANLLNHHLHHNHVYNQYLSAYGNAGEAMHLFDQLLHNKNFLLTFLSAYTSKHRSTADLQALASLVCLSLRDNLPYLYSIIKSLIAEHIRVTLSSVAASTNAGSRTTKSSRAASAATKAASSLFRTSTTATTNTESEFVFIECLVSSWLAMYMFEFLRDTQCSTHLYRLVRALGHYIDSAPVDAVQNKALNSLSESSLLFMPSLDSLPYQTLYVNVLLATSGGMNATMATNANKNLYVVPLVDLDTVEQAKRKCLDVIARHGGFLTAASRPDVRDVDLELCLIIIPSEQQQESANTSTMITLRDTEDELLIHHSNGYENLIFFFNFHHLFVLIN